MKILYLAYFDSEFSQIIDKMNHQINGLEQAGATVKGYIIGKKINNDILKYKNLKFINENNKHNKIIISDKIIQTFSPDIIYIRYQGKIMVCEEFITWISNYDNVVYELQTKKDIELKNQKSFDHLQMEQRNGKILRKNALGLVCVSNDVLNYYKDELSDQSIPMLVMGNGHQVSSETLKSKCNFHDDQIVMTAIGRFDVWHGFDRIIRGVSSYHGDNILIYLVGHGKESIQYQNMIKKYGLEKKIKLTGWMDNKAIINILDNTDIAFNSLGLHRINLNEVSTLKIKKYLSKGIPVVTSCSDVDIDRNSEFLLKVPADDSPIDINAVVSFARRIYQIPEINTKIRNYAFDKLDWNKKTKNLFSFLCNLSNKNSGIGQIQTKTIKTKLKTLFMCHDFPPYRVAGAQLYAKNLAHEINKQGLAEVEVLYPEFRNTNNDSYNIRQKKIEGLIVHELCKEKSNEPEKIYNKKVADSLRTFFKNNKFNVIHFHGLGQLSLAPIFTAHELGIKTVMTLHDYWFLCDRWHMIRKDQSICSGPENYRKCTNCYLEDQNLEKSIENYNSVHHYKSIRKTTVDAAFSKLDVVHSPSKYLKQIYERFGYHGITTYPLGFNFSELSKTNPEQNNKIVFGYAGQIIARKGVNFLVDAFKGINNPKIELHIWGHLKKNAEYAESIIQSAKSDPRIKLFGTYSPHDLADIFKSFDIAAIPSLMENYPLVVQEAFMHKTPVIATRVGGIPESVTHGVNGIIITPASANEFKKAMQDIISNPDMLDKLRQKIPPVKKISEDACYFTDQYNQITRHPGKKADLLPANSRHSPHHKKFAVQFYVYKNVHWPMFEELYKFIRGREDVKEIILCLPDLVQLGSHNHEFIERLMALDATLVSRPRTDVDVTFIADTIAGKVAGCGKLVNVGHGTISKGYYFTDSVWTDRENWVDLLCVPGQYAQGQLKKILATKVVATGMPKLDPVFGQRYDREYLCKKFNIDRDQKIILYAPTFNIDLSSVFNFADDFHKLARKDSCVLIKLHGSTLPYLVSQYRKTAENTPGIFFIDDPNLAPYLGGADIMISDVSSAFMEFMAMDKPVILYNNPNRANYHGFNPDNIEYKWRDLGVEVSSLEEARKTLNTLIEHGDDKRSPVRKTYASELFSDLSGNASANVWEETRKVIEASSKEQIPWFSIIVCLMPENLFAIRTLVDKIQFYSVMPLEIVIVVKDVNEDVQQYLEMLYKFSQFNKINTVYVDSKVNIESMKISGLHEAKGEYLIYAEDNVNLYKNFDYILFKTFEANPTNHVLTGLTISDYPGINCEEYIPIPKDMVPARYAYELLNKYKAAQTQKLNIDYIPPLFAFSKKMANIDNFRKPSSFATFIIKNIHICLSLFYTTFPLNDMQIIKNFFKQKHDIPVDAKLEILKTIKQNYNFPDLNEHLIFDSLKAGIPRKDLVSHVWPSLYMRYYDVAYKKKLLTAFSDFPSIKNILRRDISLINKMIKSDKNLLPDDNFRTDNLSGLHKVQDYKVPKKESPRPPGDDWKEDSNINYKPGNLGDISRKISFEYGKGKRQDCPRVMFYFFKNVHIPVMLPVYKEFKKLYPDVETAFGYMQYAPRIRAGFTPDELEKLKAYGQDMYATPQDFKPDITFIADSVYPWVQNCGKLVHVGHGVLSKGQYYNDTETARREEQADLVCVPGKHHQKIMRRIISKPVMATGMAKLDDLFAGKINRQKVVRRFGLPGNKKYILFAPTFNDELSAIPHVREDIVRIIPEKDTFLLIKLHGSTREEYKNMYKNLPSKDSRVIYADDLDITPFLALADVLVSDVSSAMMEFAALDKPVVLFNNPDWEKYENYNPADIEYKWRDIGIETTSIEEMRDAVAACLENPGFKSDKRKEYTDLLFANKYDGRAAERVVKMAMGMFVSA